MRPTRTTAAILGVCWLTLSCSDPAKPPAPVPEEAPLTAVEATHITEQLARAFAAALAREEVRAAVRDAMRASRVSEHKLILQEFARTPAGRLLLDAAASPGRSRDDLAALINRLPPMDFYVPFREQRRSWTGTAGVVVFGMIATEVEQLVGYAADGAVREYRLSDAAPSYPVMFIHPAEPKARRVDPQPDRPGLVIQDPDDGELSGRIAWIEPDGTIHEAEFADLEDHESEVTLLDHQGTDAAYLDYYHYYDDGDPGDEEVRFDATFYRANGVVDGTGRLEYFSTDPDIDYYPHHALIFRRPAETTIEKIHVHVWEIDCGCWGNDNDNRGVRDFFASDRGQTRSITAEGEVTNVELDWTPKAAPVVTTVTVSPNPATVVLGSGMSLVARAYDQYGSQMSGQSVSSWWTSNSSVATVNSSGYLSAVSNGSTTAWAQIAGVNGSTPVNVTTSLGVSINGPYEVEPNQTCYWWASVSGGSGSYTYSWSVNGMWQSGSSELYYANSGWFFEIQLSVTDSNGASGSDSRQVQVASGSGACPL